MGIRSEELRHLREILLRMAMLVERSIRNSVKSLIDRDSEPAKRVIQRTTG